MPSTRIVRVMWSVIPRCVCLQQNKEWSLYWISWPQVGNLQPLLGLLYLKYMIPKILLTVVCLCLLLWHCQRWKPTPYVYWASATLSYSPSLNSQFLIVSHLKVVCTVAFRTQGEFPKHLKDNFKTILSCKAQETELTLVCPTRVVTFPHWGASLQIASATWHGLSLSGLRFQDQPSYKASEKIAA